MEHSEQQPAGYAPPAIAARRSVAEPLIAGGVSSDLGAVSAHFGK